MLSGHVRPWAGNAGRTDDLVDVRLQSAFDFWEILVGNNVQVQVALKRILGRDLWVEGNPLTISDMTISNNILDGFIMEEAF